jgi:predicted tellurium resistance membrane protein TerC
VQLFPLFCGYWSEMEILAVLTNPELWIAFFALTAFELVLGIDNNIFISILVDRLSLATKKLYLLCDGLFAPCGNA